MYLCFCNGSNKRKVIYSNYLHFQSALITFCQFICLTSLLTRCQECIDSHITSTGLIFVVDKKKAGTHCHFDETCYLYMLIVLYALKLRYISAAPMTYIKLVICTHICC